MKRDMDLVREILLRLEESGEDERTLPPLSDIGYSREKIGYHNYLLVDAGLATGIDLSSDGIALPHFNVESLTWEGHEFLDAARDEARWFRAKEAMFRAGGFSLSVMKAVLIEMLKQQVLGSE